MSTLLNSGTVHSKPEIDSTSLGAIASPDLTNLASALAGPAQSLSFAAAFLAESIDILQRLDTHEIECMATGLAAVREGGGRLFILGVGGSAGHAGHAVTRIDRRRR